MIAGAMTSCTLNKNTEARFKTSQHCLMMIEKAFAVGVVSKGPALIKKIREAETRIAGLESELEKAVKDNVYLQTKMDLMTEGQKF